MALLCEPKKWQCKAVYLQGRRCQPQFRQHRQWECLAPRRWGAPGSSWILAWGCQRSTSQQIHLQQGHVNMPFANYEEGGLGFAVCNHVFARGFSVKEVNRRGWPAETRLRAVLAGASLCGTQQTLLSVRPPAVILTENVPILLNEDCLASKLPTAFVQSFLSEGDPTCHAA